MNKKFLMVKDGYENNIYSVSSINISEKELQEQNIASFDMDKILKLDIDETFDSEEYSIIRME